MRQDFVAVRVENGKSGNEIHLSREKLQNLVLQINKRVSADDVIYSIIGKEGDEPMPRAIHAVISRFHNVQIEAFERINNAVHRKFSQVNYRILCAFCQRFNRKRNNKCKENAKKNLDYA